MTNTIHDHEHESIPCDCHAGNLDCWSSDSAPHFQVTTHHLNVEEDLLEVPCNRNLFHRVCQFPFLNPLTYGPARIVTCNQIDSKPDELRYVKATVYRGDNLFRTMDSSREIKICWRYPGRLPRRSRGISRGGVSQFSAAVGVEEITLQDTFLYNHLLSRREALAIKGLGPKRASDRSVIHNRKQLRADLGSQFAHQKRGTFVERITREGGR